MAQTVRMVVEVLWCSLYSEENGNEVPPALTALAERGFSSLRYMMRRVGG